MIIGSMMLIDVTEAPKELFSVSLRIIIPVVVFTALFFVFALSMAYRAHKKKVTTGYEGIVGEIGVAVTDVEKTGKVQVHGEYWKATADVLIPKGTDIIVQSVDRMILKVKQR